MKSRVTSRPVALITCLVFYSASVVVIWKIVEDGQTTFRLISAVGLALAGVIWTWIVFRGGSNPD